MRNKVLTRPSLAGGKGGCGGVGGGGWLCMFVSTIGRVLAYEVGVNSVAYEYGSLLKEPAAIDCK